MSSSSPRNAHSRSKAASGPRKRTQEVETDEGLAEDQHAHGAPAIAADGVTAAQMASSALDAAAAEQALRDPEATPRPGESAASIELEPFAGTEASPLGQAILGASDDMTGGWEGEARATSPAVPSTPLEMLDETDLLEEEGPEEAAYQDGEAFDSEESAFGERSTSFGSTPLAAMPDEEFLRRVVLPPLPQPAPGMVPPPEPVLYDESQDKTVISEMTPEWMARLRDEPRPPRWDLRRKLSASIEVTTLELIGLVTGAALAGGIIGALFFAVPQARSERAVAAPPAAIAPPAPTVNAAQIPIITPLPRPTVEPLPPPEPSADQAASSRGGSVGRRATSNRRSTTRKVSKKEWVDPFER